MADAVAKPGFKERIRWDDRIKPALTLLVVAAIVYLIAMYVVAPRMDAARADHLPETFLSLPLGHVALAAEDGTSTLLPVRLAETTQQRSAGLRDVGEDAIDNQFLLYVPSRATTSRTSYTMTGIRAPIELLIVDVDGAVIARHAAPIGGTRVSVPEPHRWALAAKAGSFERLGLDVGATLDPESIVKY